MMYAEARRLIRSGDLIAFRRSYWRTWHGIKVNLARWLTGSHYSHVAIAWCVSGRVFALEAVKPVLRIHPLSDLGDFYLLPMDAQWHDATEQYALRGIGKRYSELMALKAFFAPLPTVRSLRPRNFKARLHQFRRALDAGRSCQSRLGDRRANDLYRFP